MAGIISIIRNAGVDWFLHGWNSAAGRLCSGAEAIAIVPYLLLVAYMLWATLRKDKPTQ